MENKTFLELAVETFENGDVVLGAEYLLKAYYESNKSKEILGYFDEIFFKPNLEELERIYNLNSEKIKNELKKETLEFKYLAYYVIPIEENNIYVYDKENNDIVSEDFTKEQVNIIEICTNEDLSLEEDIRGYLNILLKNEDANSILEDTIHLFIKYEKYDDIFSFYKSEFCSTEEKNKEKEKYFISFLETELKDKDYARIEVVKRFASYLGRDTTYIFLNKIRLLFLENKKLDDWDIINIKEINFKDNFDICGEFIYYLIKEEIDMGDIIATLNNENLIRFIKYISDNFEDFPKLIKKYIEIYPNYRKLNDIISTNILKKGNQIKNTNRSEVFKIAEEHLAKGNDEESTLYYKDLLESKDFASLAYFRLGEIKNRQKDIKNSYEYHMKAFSVNPKLAMSITTKEHPHNNYTYKKIEEVIVHNCPICGGVSDMHSCYNMITNIDFIEGFNPIRLWLCCKECNHIFANSYPRNLEYLLKNTAPLYHLTPNVNYLPIIHDILIDVKKQAKGNRFLEIGVGSGEMTAVAKELLFDVTGVEIRKTYAERVSKRLDVPIYAENIMNFNTKKPFDVICMGDVIEHLVDPKSLIGHIVSLLKEDGIFWLSTPNFQSAFSLTIKDKDPMWRVCEHLNYFSFDSMKRLLEMYGLEVINYKPSKHYNGSMEIISKKSSKFKIEGNTKPETTKFRSKKLHVGCGRNILEGWINLDLMPLSGVDVVADLDDCQNNPLPLSDNSIEEFYVSHVIEHINNPLSMMEELHRVALPNAKAVFRCPYGSTDEAFEDPTHVKQYFLNSFGYFSQPFYWRADYGYRGDWLTEKIILVVDKNRNKGKSPQKILEEINLYRNVVKEMIVELRAIKPIRETKMELQVQPKIEISLG